MYQNSANKCNFKQGGSQIEYKSTEDKADASCSSVNGFWQCSSLPVEMETQVQVMKVKEDILCYPSDGVLGDFPKDRISGFIK